MKILLIEDEEHIGSILAFNFQKQGYEVDWALSGEKALAHWQAIRYDLIILDVMLPGIDGFEVARQIRARDGRIPILMLTALASDEDRVAGLECGVDDYLAKPFVLKELLLRIAGLLRRAQWATPLPEQSFSIGRATIDPATLTATGKSFRASLTRLEVDLLRYFVANPNRLVSREELLSHVWGYEPDTATRTVDTFLMRVRKVIEPTPAKPQFLRSMRGQGYRYSPTGKEQ